MKAIWRGQVIAESDRTLEVGGYRYFPREAVRMDLLQTAPKTQSDLACPNGVQFYDVTDGAAQSRRAAWSYEVARAGMQQVDHWIVLQLQRDGLITVKPAASDRRAKEVRLTKAGEKRLRAALKGWSQAQARFEAVLGARRAADLRRLLRAAAASEFAPAIQSANR